jgi:hypothetical protein
VDIARLAFSGTVTNLLYLDERFANDEPFPRDRYTVAIDQGGGLAIEACGHPEGCRLWSVAPGASSAGQPVVVDSEEFACFGIDATPQWLLVYDDEVCFLDYSPADIPLRSISRTNGSNQRINNGSEDKFGRLVVIDGRTYGVGIHRADDWSTTDLIRIDVATGSRSVLVPGLSNAVETYVRPDRRHLVDPWVLVRPDVFFNTMAPPDGLLFNVQTREVIRLPPGTVGVGVLGGWDQ